MAEIIAYPVGQPDRESQLIGTQVGVVQANGQEVNLTRNFTVGSILGLLDNQFVISEFELTTDQLANLGTTAITLVTGQVDKYVDVNSVFFKIVGQTLVDNLDFTGDVIIESTKPPGPWNYTIAALTLNSGSDPISYKPVLTPGQVIKSEGIQIGCSNIVNSVGVPTTTAKVYITYRFLS